MGLIDANKIPYLHLDLENKVRFDDVNIAFKDDIDNMPTVEAIPIKWIEKWAITTNMGAGRTIDRLLEDWEKEQARLFEKQITEECTSAERFADWEKENALDKQIEQWEFDDDMDWQEIQRKQGNEKEDRT